MWLLSITIILGYMNTFNKVKISLVYSSCLVTFVMQIFVNKGYIQNIKKQKSVKKNNGYKIKNLEDIQYVLFNTQYYLSTI